MGPSCQNAAAEEGYLTEEIPRKFSEHEADLCEAQEGQRFRFKGFEVFANGLMILGGFACAATALVFTGCPRPHAYPNAARLYAIIYFW